MKKGIEKKPPSEVVLNYKRIEESLNTNQSEAFQQLFERAEELYWSNKLETKK